MTNDQKFIQEWLAAEKLALLCARFRRGYKVVFCPNEKKRIAWDHYKSQLQLIRQQHVFIDLCDGLVTDDEMQTFLLSQDLNLPLSARL